MAKPKEEKKKLFWIVAILAAVPAVCFFVVGIYDVADKTPWFIAGFTYLVAVFTFLLWRATKKYAETTEGLLEQSKQAVEQSRLLAEVTKEYTEATKELLNQSKQAVEQSRISFIGSIIDTTIEYAENLPIQNKEAKQRSYILNKARAIGAISIERSGEFLKAMSSWKEGKDKEIEEKLKQTVEKLKELEIEQAKKVERMVDYLGTLNKSKSNDKKANK